MGEATNLNWLAGFQPSTVSLDTLLPFFIKVTFQNSPKKKPTNFPGFEFGSFKQQDPIPTPGFFFAGGFGRPQVRSCPKAGGAALEVKFSLVFGDPITSWPLVRRE